jgi:hypothetical protein
LQLGEIPHFEFLRGESCNDGSQLVPVEHHGRGQAEDIESFSGDESVVVTLSPKKKTRSQAAQPVHWFSTRVRYIQDVAFVGCVGCWLW